MKSQTVQLIEYHNTEYYDMGTTAEIGCLYFTTKKPCIGHLTIESIIQTTCSQ